MKNQIDQGRGFQAPFIGRFSISKSKKVVYIPSLEILEATGFQIKDNSDNMCSPFESKIEKDEKVSQMSASAIANVCSCTRADVLHILKDLFLRIVENCKEGNQVILDCKIG